MAEEQVAEGGALGNRAPLPGKEGKAKARRKVAEAPEGKELPEEGGAVGVPSGEGAEEEGDSGVSRQQVRREAIAIANALKRREEEYNIRNFNWSRKEGKFIPQQQELVEEFVSRLLVPLDVRKNVYLYQGGNRAGKTAGGAFLTTCFALDAEAKKKLGLPPVGHEKVIMVLTKSGANVKDVIEPYLLGSGSIARIPPEYVKDARRDNGILKSIILHDGTVITIGTYDAGYEVAQGKSPGFVWLDEEPLDEKVMKEAFARTLTMGSSGDSCKLLMTMSPLNGPSTPAMEWFENPPGNFGRFVRTWRVSMLDNPWANKNAAEMFSGADYAQRVEGLAVNPTGLVYREFRRDRNVVPHFDPRDLGEGTRYYCGIDFGVTHPTAISMIAVDRDFNHYVFDVWKRSDASLKEIADQYRLMTKNYDLEYTVGDSAAKRESHELNAQFGIRITPADKASKGENGESNRRAGILHINQLMKDGKFVVSERCKDLIKEYETHYYKDTEKDGQVVKDNDDIGDSLRYAAFLIKKNKIGINESKFRSKFHTSSKSVILGHNANAKKLTIRY